MSSSEQERIWLAKAIQGDPLATAGLLAAHYPLLRSRAEVRMDQAVAAKLDPEDILQEVYLDVFRNIDRFQDRGPGSFVKWLMTILDSKLINARRALQRQKRDMAREVSPRASGGTESYLDLINELRADSPTPSRVVRRQEAVGALLVCMSRLSDVHRQVVQLRYVEGCSVDEVAGRLGRSPGAVVALTKRALKALRESMDRLGDFTRGA